MIAPTGWRACRRARRRRAVVATMQNVAAALAFLALACGWGNG